MKEMETIYKTLFHVSGYDTSRRYCIFSINDQSVEKFSSLTHAESSLVFRYGAVAFSVIVFLTGVKEAAGFVKYFTKHLPLLVCLTSKSGALI